MSGTDETDDVDAIVDDLAASLAELRRAVTPGGRVPRREERRGRGHAGDRETLPRPPSPGELARFTEQYTIPTLIAVLETTISVLELVRATLRLAGGRGLPRRSTRRDAGRVVGETGQRALDTLDVVLDDLQDAVEGRPTDPRARDLLDEARALRSDIDDLVAGREGGAVGTDRADTVARESDDHRTGAPTDDAVTIHVADEGGEMSDGDAPEEPEPEPEPAATAPDDARDDEVDIEAELDTIKRELGREEDDGSDPTDEE